MARGVENLLVDLMLVLSEAALHLKDGVEIAKLRVLLEKTFVAGALIGIVVDEGAVGLGEVVDEEGRL